MGTILKPSINVVSLNNRYCLMFWVSSIPTHSKTKSEEKKGGRRRRRRGREGKEGEGRERGGRGEDAARTRVS
jgi:hypothetical protein